MRDITAKEYIIIQWVFIGLCFIFVFARIAVRTWKRTWKFWLSEVWLAIGVLTFTAIVIGGTCTWLMDQGDYALYYGPVFAKWQFAVTVIFDLGFYFPRFSLLAFYNELFPISEEGLRKVLYAVIAYNAAAFVCVALMDIFWCGLPLSQNWTKDSSCTLMQSLKVLYINWPIGLVAELLVFLLPFGMLRTLKKASLKEKIALMSVFSLGIANIAMSVARIIFYAGAIFSHNAAVVGSAEIASQIIVCALPALRPLIPVISAYLAKVSSLVTGSTNTSDDEERTLHGSYDSSHAEKKAGQKGANIPQLATWRSNSMEGNAAELSPHHTHGTEQS